MITTVQLFQSAIDAAVGMYERNHGTMLPKKYKVIFHGLSLNGEIITIMEAANLLDRGDEYFRIIDVMVLRSDSECTYLFVRPSGHPLGSMNQTWNPSEYGPFRVMET